MKDAAEGVGREREGTRAVPGEGELVSGSWEDPVAAAQAPCPSPYPPLEPGAETGSLRNLISQGGEWR